MAVPNTFQTATSAIPLANLDANFTYYDNAFSISGTATTFTGTATATKLIPTGSSATGNGLYLPAANSVGISTNGTNAVYIDSSQNVGIGVSTVATNFRTQFLGTAGSNTSAASSGTTQAASAVLRLQAGGGFTATLDIGQGGGTGSWLQSCDTGNLATTYPLLLNPVGGNVGIGTTSINSRLVVSNGSNKNIEFQPGATSYLFAYDRTASDYLNLDIAGETLTFSTDNGTERARIDTGGNVGIGITNPARKLVVSNAGAAGFEVGPGTGPSSGNEFLNYNRSTSAYLKQTTYSSEYLFYAGAGASITALIIDTSGNVGIGASPTAKLDVSGGSLRVNEDGAGTKVITLRSDYAGVGPAVNVTTNNPLLFLTNNSERARIDTSGNLLVGTTNTTPASSNVNGFAVSSSGFISLTGDSTAAIDCNRTSDGTVQAFRRSGTLVGSVSVTTTATAYNTSSDYRLKNTIALMTNALAKVALLKPCTYKWNADGSDGQGFIAHELAEVVPQCVTGEKDAVNEDGSIKSQGIDTSFLVATLTAAIQEQQALITSLTARITALEST